jgi:L-malate glycosyltransferase
LKNINILHICSYYTPKNFYKYLFKEIENDECIKNQKVFVALLKNANANTKEQKIIYKKTKIYQKRIYNFSDRFFFFSRLLKSLIEIKRMQLVINQNIIIHAHTLFTNGAIGYFLKKKYGTKYIVAVRNTDINVFYKYFYFLRPLASRILMNAERVIFLSPAYKEILNINYIKQKNLETIKNKELLIPNGIDDYWHLNYCTSKRYLKKVKKLIFVGDININKNIKIVLDFVRELNNKEFIASITIVGDGVELGRLQSEYQDDFITFCGRINEISILRQLYVDSDIFIMTSLNETFGLAYVEALSQGLPIIYTRGQGIDGFFSEGEVGYSVRPKIIEDYYIAFTKIVKNYNGISSRCTSQLGKFKWDIVAKSYIEIYKNIDL